MKLSWQPKRWMRIFLRWRMKHITHTQFIYILSVLVGLAVGLSVVILKNTVHLIQHLLTFGFSKEYFHYPYVIYPTIGILITVLFVKYVIKKPVRSGVPLVLNSLSKQKGKIESHNMYSSIVASALTVGFGGSVGLEGPSVATGSAIGSNIGRLFHLHYKDIILLLGCAAAGAMAAIFKAPIAGIVFALEVIMLDLTMTRIIPLLLSTVTGTMTSYLIYGQEVLYKVELTESFHIDQLPFFILLGVIAGFVSIYFTHTFLYINKRFSKVNSWYKRLLFGSILLGVLIFFFPSLYGEGYEDLNLALNDNLYYLYEESIFYDYQHEILLTAGLLIFLVLFKVVATAITIAAGGVGGIFAPSLFIGANTGLAFSTIANLFNAGLSNSTFALVGMAGLMAGVIHAPLTAIFMIAEITGGYELFIPLMIVSTIAYATTKIFVNNSVYTTQLAKAGELMTHHKDKAILRMMNIEKLIEKNFEPVPVDGTLQDLIDAIARSTRNVFPVVDPANRLVGLVTLDSVRDKIFKPELYQEILIKELLYVPTQLVNRRDSMEEVAQKFNTSGKYVLAVVDEDKYLGFVSRSNVFSKYRRLIKHFSED